MTRAKAMLGRTVFEVADDPSNPQLATITRTNVDGVRDFHIPRALLVEYAKELIKQKIVFDPLWQEMVE